MKSAYHQVELPADQQIFTAFEADSGLYQWRRIPFGLTKAVPALFLTHCRRNHPGEWLQRHFRLP